MTKDDKQKIASQYIKQVLEGHLTYVSPKVVLFKQFINLCKKHTGCTIYQNFGREYSIFSTHLSDEIKLN